MKRLISIVYIIMFLVQFPAFSKKTGADKTARAVEITGESPSVDGILDEQIWREAPPITDFLQKDPREGAEPSHDVQVRFLYDEDALYIGAHMNAGSPDSIQALVSRRDHEGNSERIKFSFDTYRDFRTAYTLGVTASGVRTEYYHAADKEFDRDHSWDPIWEAGTTIDSTGWTAEMRIPFSQLRFNKKKVQVWGLNVNWWIPVLREDTYWVLIPKNETGWSSKMGKLVGIEGITPSSRIELLPYVAGNTIANPHIDKANPFVNKVEPNFRAGLDYKMGLGPNLTLDAAINPDFGQVEADPAEVNLSAYETFFAEKRPFFLEGKRLIEGGGHNYFYSRRIGSQPHGNPDGEYIDKPNNTRIIGAAKVTGRSKSGLSVGGVTALTAEEYADVFIDSTEKEVKVEPLTSYNALRLQQEFGEDASTVGLMLTGVYRNMEEDSYLVDQLTRQAYSGGADWNIRFNKGEYVLSGHFGFSNILGSEDAIMQVQQSSAHYFQRPDQDHVKIDSNATEMTGCTGNLGFSKNAGEHWLWGASVWLESPNFEINDMGQLHAADNLNFSGHLTYRENEPGDLFYSYNFSLAGNQERNFGGLSLREKLELSTNLTFHDRSSISFNFEHYFPGLSDNLTRGGPIMGLAMENVFATGYSSDWSRKIRGSANISYSHSETGRMEFNTRGSFRMQTTGRLEFSVSPGYNYRIEDRQYITTIPTGNPTTYNNRYIFSYIRRNTLSTTFRLNYAFSPDLTLEIYAEPFAASGRYYDFGELKKPESKELRYYGENGTIISGQEEGEYKVVDGDESFEFTRNDFNVLSFRSNVVLRWQYLPGSTIFLVWQQNRLKNRRSRSPVGIGDMFGSAGAEGINTFALKISYWLPVD